MEWVEIVIKSTTEATDVISNILYDLGIKGVVIEDENDEDILNFDDIIWDYKDDNLNSLDYDGAIIKAYVSKEENIAYIIDKLKDKLYLLPNYGFDIGEGLIELNNVKEEDWENEWKKYYKTLEVGKNIIIKPDWEEFETHEDKILIELDPGMAFGTGTHETTFMSIEALEREIKKGYDVLDVGCGSGILSILASKLGARNVIGIDIDPVAIKVAKENVIKNNVEENITIKKGNLLDGLDGKFDIIAINIMADIIIKVIPHFSNYIKPGGKIIASGIIKDKQKEVEDNFIKNGFKISSIKEKGEWVLLEVLALE